MDNPTKHEGLEWIRKQHTNGDEVYFTLAEFAKCVCGGAFPPPLSTPPCIAGTLHHTNSRTYKFWSRCAKSRLWWTCAARVGGGERFYLESECVDIHFFFRLKEKGTRWTHSHFLLNKITSVLRESVSHELFFLFLYEYITDERCISIYRRFIVCEYFHVVCIWTSYYFTYFWAVVVRPFPRDVVKIFIRGESVCYKETLLVKTNIVLMHTTHFAFLLHHTTSLPLLR